MVNQKAICFCILKIFILTETEGIWALYFTILKLSKSRFWFDVAGEFYSHLTRRGVLMVL